MLGRKTARVLCLSLVVLAVTFFGCGPRQNSRSSSQSVGSTIAIKGSDTMLHLVKAWTDAYMKAHPDAKISVTGGGSGTGIAALLNGTTDICAASRDLSEEEKTSGASKGLTLNEVTVARDALSLIVNPKNPIDELTIDQIAQIFTGAVGNWKDIGGPDETIVVASRESSSGTYMFFQEHVLKKKDYAAGALLLTATSAIVQSVADSEGAIGYVGLGYAVDAGGKIKTIGVKTAADAPVVFPSVDTVLNGQYSISRPLFLIVSKEPAGTIKDFLDFCVSPEGQKIVEDSGYVKVN